MQNKELKRKALEKIKSMGNGNKGITLVALVVTIVILLILAGITIELTLGSDGIIQKTKFAKNQSCMQSDKEAIQIAYSTVYHLYDKVVTAQDLQVRAWTSSPLLPTATPPWASCWAAPLR